MHLTDTRMGGTLFIKALLTSTGNSCTWSGQQQAAWPTTLKTMTKTPLHRLPLQQPRVPYGGPPFIPLAQPRPALGHAPLPEPSRRLSGFLSRTPCHLIPTSLPPAYSLTCRPTGLLQQQQQQVPFWPASRAARHSDPFHVTAQVLLLVSGLCTCL